MNNGLRDHWTTNKHTHTPHTVTRLTERQTVSFYTHSSSRLREEVLLLFPCITSSRVEVMDDRADPFELLSAILLEEEGLLPVDELVPGCFGFRTALGDRSGLCLGLQGKFKTLS